MSGPFTGLLVVDRSLVNEADEWRVENSSWRRVLAEPGMNAGPTTGCAGNARKTSYFLGPVDLPSF